jgi:predicted dehydrogenase
MECYRPTGVPSTVVSMCPRPSKLRIALVGAGAMGSLHARVVAQSQDAELVCVVDPDRESGEALAERWRSSWVPELESFRGIGGIIIASPTDSHIEWASRAIDADTPVLVEKPISDDIVLTEALLARAGARTVPLTCGLLERFNAALCTALEIIVDPVLVTTVRHSHHLSRITTGVAYDLLIHDIDLVLRMAGGMPASVTGHFGFVHPDSPPGAEDIAEATLRFNGGMLATHSVNRISQRKVRTLVVNELHRLVEVDRVRQDVTVYRHIEGEWLDGQGGGVRQQTVIDIPIVQNMREPLAGQLDHFIALARGQLDAAAELATLRAPHAVVARVIEYADLDAMGTGDGQRRERRRRDRQDAHRPALLDSTSAHSELA